MEDRSHDYSRVLQKYDLYKIHLVSPTLCNTVILHYTPKAYTELEKCLDSLWSDILKQHSSQTYVSCITTTRCYSGTWTSCAWQQHALQSDSAAQLDLTYCSLIVLLSCILPISSSPTLFSLVSRFTVTRCDFLSLITCKHIEFYSDF